MIFRKYSIPWQRIEEAMKPRPSLVTLPVEIKLQILRFLDRRDLRSILRCCIGTGADLSLGTPDNLREEWKERQVPETRARKEKKPH